MRRVWCIIGDVVFVLVLLALLGGSLMFALNQDPNKTFLGCRVYNILSGSMEPALGVGDLVVVKAVPAEEIQNGDIITYYPTGQAGATVTHRVVRTMLRDGQVVIETKGDAADQSDPLFYGDAVIGVVIFHIPLLGGMLAWIQGHALLSLALLALAVAAVWGIGAVRRRKRRENGGDQDG